MYRGSDLLRESDRKLADVAQAVGYDSDGAFHKAFKRVLGIAPGEYRRSVSTL
jgi:transcriptional regulator GlxA family with amidase domain